MSTPTKKPSKTRKPSQTAKILESVELLIALHEEQESTRSETQETTLKVFDQLQQLEDKLARISSLEPEASSADASQPKLLESLVEKLDSLDQRLSSFESQPAAPANDLSDQLQKMESSIVKQLEAKLAGQLKQVDQQTKNKNKSSKSENNQVDAKLLKQQQEQHKALAENLDLISAQLEELQSKPSSPEFDSEALAESIAQAVSTQIADCIDQRFNRLTESQQATVDQLAEQLTESISNQIESSLGNTLQSQLDSAFQSIDSRPPTSTSEESAEQLELFVEHIETKLTESAEQQTELNDKLQKQLGEVQSQLTQIETQRVFQSETETNANGLTRDEVSEAVETQIASLKEHLESLLSEMAVATQSGTTSDTSKTTSDEPIADSPEEDDEDSASHWHRQKKAMLEKYGIDPEYRPLEEEKKKKEEKQKQAEKIKLANAAAKDGTNQDGISADSNLESLHESIDNISKEDLEAVEQLKKDLNSKLRDAEIELSINRAKLSREKAELEQKAAELEQRAADLESKLAATKDAPDSQKKGGIMSRISRHLGKS